MKKLLLSIFIILLAVSCNDSSRGVLQWAYQFAEEEESYNQSYLGNDGTRIYLERDWDIYKAYSVQRSNGNGYEIRYEKVLESSKDDPFPIVFLDGYLYMAYKDSTTKLYQFFRVRVPESGEITLDELNKAMTDNKCTITGVSDITSFAVSRIAPDKIQILYKLLQGENNLSPAHYAQLEINGTSMSLSSQFSVPSNSQMIGDGVLKATTDDPEIEGLPDNMNDLYVIIDGTMSKIYTAHDSRDYPMGSDGNYAALASGEICAIDTSYKENGYDGRLRQSDLRFDVLDREVNYLTIYRDGNSVVGYLSDNGIYWREDINDTSESNNKSRPSIISVTEDADVVPLCFAGKNGSNREYLMITQDNGFYVVRPEASGTQRLEKIRSGSGYMLSDFL